MTNLFKAKVTIPQGILVSKVGDETVILNLQNERYFGLDPIGTKMWQALTTTESVQATFDLLAGKFQVDGETLSRDLSAFVEGLHGHGLVEINL